MTSMTTSNALRRAADAGWADLSSGSYVDIDDADLEAYISRLGNPGPESGNNQG